MGGQTISINSHDGKSFSAYLGIPPSGSGPGLLVLQEIFGVNAHIRAVVERWAADGYVALAPDVFWRVEPGVDLGYTPQGMQKGRNLRQQLDLELVMRDLATALDAVRARPECTGKAGAVGYCFGGLLAYLTAARTDVEAAVSYYGGGVEQRLHEAKSIRCPIMFHWGEQDGAILAAAREAARAALAGDDDAEFYLYRGAQHGFNCDLRASFHPFAAQLARSRTIGLLRRTIGPRYDLSALWDNHCDLEFTARDADATMATMTPEPYVNHIPTLTGGYGYRELHRFYKYHFIPTLPEDTKIVPISRTIGPDRIVDEILFCFTHTRELDFLLPGVKPTGRYVELPTIAVVEFRGDKLVSEHIYWDQASALRQIGALEAGGLPISGVEQAKKLVDEEIPSNAMMPAWKSSTGQK
ncbi:MAG TPA: dienelactone hydrolase family protein [Candidatus Binataceae bacterium]|nr:dienelactone hydrolase family protein [Candidatus Binataceae bacterium]